MVPILFGLHILFGRPFSTWLDGDLVRIPSLAQNLLDVLIDGQGFIRNRLAAYWACPCRSLLLELQE